jgi:ribosomal protein S18 acetylase RimI-like enzyme
VGGWLARDLTLRAVLTLLASSIGKAPDMQDCGDSQVLKLQLSPQPTAGPGTMPGERAGGTLRASLTESAIALRSATRADAEFCYQLHKAAMGEYITAIWGWDEQVQRAFHERAFNPRRWQIITDGEVDAGMLDVECRPGEIYLSRIEIDPGHQGRGIGTRIICALLVEAERNGQDLVLEVLTVNRRARALYQRLGLTEVARPGDRGIKVAMRSVRHRK